MYPEYVVLSTAGSRYGGELQIRRHTRCVWPLAGTRQDMEQATTGALKRDPELEPAKVHTLHPQETKSNATLQLRTLWL